MRFTIVIAVALLCVVLGIAFLKLSAPSEVRAPAGVTQVSSVSTEDVLVARDDIPVGTFITADMVERQPWPKNLVLQGFVTGENKNLVGMVTRSDVRAREPFDLSKLSKPLEGGYIASFLPKGMRAVTIQVNSISGVAGYIFPGDHVDVILTHSIPQKIPSDLWGEHTNEMGQTPTTSEALLSDIKVLAINDRKEEQPQATQIKVQGTNPHHVTEATPINITVAVSPEDGEKLRLGEKNGTLALALRSTREAGGEQTPSTPVTLVDLSRVPTVTASEGIVVVRGIKGEAATSYMPGSQPIPTAPDAADAGR